MKMTMAAAAVVSATMMTELVMLRLFVICFTVPMFYLKKGSIKKHSIQHMWKTFHQNAALLRHAIRRRGLIFTGNVSVIHIKTINLKVVKMNQ